MQLYYFLLQRWGNIIRYEKIKVMQHLHMLKHGYRIPTAILVLEDLVLGLSHEGDSGNGLNRKAVMLPIIHGLTFKLNLCQIQLFKTQKPAVYKHGP